MASAVIGALRIIFSADTAEFKRNATEAEKIAHRLGTSIGSSLRKQFLSLGAAIAAVAGPAALGLFIKSTIDTISAQVDLSKRVGASVSAIQTLQQAAELSGASNEALTKTLEVLNQRLGEAAREGAGPAFEAVKRLGLSIQELSAMDADERIKAISNAMSDLSMTTQQQADTLRDLGVKNKEIINLFQEGANAIDSANQELKELGVLLSDADASKVEEAGDALDKLWIIARGLGNQLAVALSPSIIKFTDHLLVLAKNGDLARVTVDKLVSSFNTLAEILVQIGAYWDFINRKLQLGQEVATALNQAFKTGDLTAYSQAHAKSAEDVAKIWSDMDARLAELRGPGPLLNGLENYLNRISPLVQSVDKYIAKLNATMGGGSGTSEAEQKEADKRAKELAAYQDHLMQKLSILQESLLTEREAIDVDYGQRLTDLKNFHNQGLLSDEQYHDLLMRSSKDHADKIKELNEEVARDALRNVQKQLGAYETLANDIGTVLNAIFGESKLVAIAQAIINTAQAITRNLAEYPGPLGFAMAAAAAAAGAAQIATISRTTKTSKGGGGGSNGASTPSVSSGGGTGTSSQPQQQNATLFINGLTAGSWLSSEAVRELAEKMIEYQRDGGKIVLGPA